MIWLWMISLMATQAFYLAKRCFFRAMQAVKQSCMKFWKECLQGALFYTVAYISYF